MSPAALDVILAILRTVISLVEQAFSGHADAGKKVLALLPDGELKTTTIRKFAEAQAAAKFNPPQG